MSPTSSCLICPYHNQTVRPSEVRIMVIANLILSPPDAYVLKHATVKYKVELLRHNSLKGYCCCVETYTFSMVVKSQWNALWNLKIILL